MSRQTGSAAVRTTTLILIAGLCLGIPIVGVVRHMTGGSAPDPSHETSLSALELHETGSSADAAGSSSRLDNPRWVATSPLQMMRGGRPWGTMSALAKDHATYNDQTTEGEELEEEEEEEEEIHTRLFGEVLDQHGEPIAEAIIMVVDPSFSLAMPLEITQTDNSGQYELTELHEIWGHPDNINALVIASAPHAINQTKLLAMSAGNTEVRLDFLLLSGSAFAGHVYDHLGAPVPNARIMVFKRHQYRTIEGDIVQGTTDSEGYFRFEAIQPGRLRVTVLPEGESIYQFGGHFTLPEGGNEDAEVRLLERQGVVTGRVVEHGTEQPVQGVEVWLGDDLSGLDSWTLLTDADGLFRFEGIPTEWWHLQCPAYPETMTTVDLDPTYEVDITLRIGETLVVSGTVVEAETGEPMTNCGLRLWVRERNIAQSTRTDEQGHFEFPQVSPNRFQGEVQGETAVNIELTDDLLMLTDGGRIFSRNAQGDAFRDLRIEVIEAQPLQVTALDPNGLRISGAQIWIDEGNDTQRNLGSTDSRGEWEGLRARDITESRVHGTHPEWPVMRSDPFGPEETEVVLQAEPTRQLAVNVIGLDGQPAPGVTVETIARIVAPSGVDTNGTRVLQTDEAGRVIFNDLAACAQRVTTSAHAHPWGLLPVVSEEIDLTSVDSPVTATLDLRDAEEVVIHGIVSARGTGEPISGARISLTGNVDLLGFISAPTVHTDAEGYFAITVGDRASQMNFYVTADDWADPNVHYVNIGSPGPHFVELIPSDEWDGHIRQ